MFVTKVDSNFRIAPKTFGELKEGDIARITDNVYRGDVVLATFGGVVVSLTKPGRCWTGANSVQIELLPVGSSVTLTVTD